MPFIHVFLLAYAVMFASISVAFGSVTDTFQRSYPLSKNASVTASTSNGDITVTGWDRDEVMLEVTKSANDRRELALTRVDIVSQPDAFVVTTHYEKGRWWKFWESNDTRVSYILHVPRNLTLGRFDGVKTAITINGLKGRLELTSVDGSISTNGSGNLVHAATVNGAVNLAFESLPVAGKISVRTVKGSSHVQIPPNSIYTFEGKTIKGTVSAVPSASNVESPGGRLGGGPVISLYSVKGSLTVSSP